MSNTRSHPIDAVEPFVRDAAIRLRKPSTRRADRTTRIGLAAFLTALPALAAFVMWLADPHGTAALYASRTGQTLLFAGFIWIGIGMLELRRMVISRTFRPRPAQAR